jgi:hypothetical protein
MTGAGIFFLAGSDLAEVAFVARSGCRRRAGSPGVSLIEVDIFFSARLPSSKKDP